MYHLKELIHFYNNYCNSQINVKEHCTNKYENDLHKQKYFVDSIIFIPMHIKNIQVIRKNMHDVSLIVNRIITSKMNINCDYGISNRILEYIPITCPNISMMESCIDMKTKRIEIFIQKCHNDNLIPLNSKIHETLTSKYVQHTHFGGFLYCLERIFNYSNTDFFHSYEEYYEYILYWLDHSGDHSAHFYKMKNHIF